MHHTTTRSWHGTQTMSDSHTDHSSAVPWRNIILLLCSFFVLLASRSPVMRDGDWLVAPVTQAEEAPYHEEFLPMPSPQRRLNWEQIEEEKEKDESVDNEEWMEESEWGEEDGGEEWQEENGGDSKKEQWLEEMEKRIEALDDEEAQKSVLKTIEAKKERGNGSA